MNEAMLFPLLSRQAALALMTAAALVLAVIVFIPVDPAFRAPFRLIPDAIALARHSPFQNSLAIAYSLAVYLGILCAVVTSMARGDLAGYRQMQARQSSLFKLAADMLFMILIGSLLTTVIFSENVETDGILLTIVRHRFAACIWVVGIFSFVYVGTLGIIFRLSQIGRYIRTMASR